MNHAKSLRCAFALGLFFSSIIFCHAAFAADITPAPKPQWMVLIQSRSYPGYSKELLEKDGTPEAALERNGATESKWDTLFANANSQAHLPGLYIAADHIFAIKQKTLASTRKNHVGYKTSSSLTKLVSVQLGTKQEKRFLGNASDLNGYDAEQLDRKPDNNDCKDGIIYTYSEDYRVLSVLGPYVSVKKSTSSYAYGAPHPYGSDGWDIYKITPVGLKPYKLPISKAMKSQIRAGCKKLFGEYPDDDAYPDHGGALCPYGGTGMLETYFSPVRTEQGVVLTKLRQALPLAYEKIKNEFVKQNPTLVAWSKAKIFTVAPDQSAVAYVLDKTLYWRSVSASKPKVIGNVVDVRGWQWTDANKLNDIERQKLGGTF